MASRPARPLRSNRQKRGNSAHPANSIGAPTRPLKIGEAARMLGVETYVLRFWETQFPDLHPVHTATKHRLYSAHDMETLRLIKHLLYEEGFTIEGARKRIKELGGSEGQANAAAKPNSVAKTARPVTTPKADEVHPHGGPAIQTLMDIRRDLESIYQLLKD